MIAIKMPTSLRYPKYNAASSLIFVNSSFQTIIVGLLLDKLSKKLFDYGHKSLMTMILSPYKSLHQHI